MAETARDLRGCLGPDRAGASAVLSGELCLDGQGDLVADEGDGERRGFTNREVWLAPEMRLRDFKDNLETRLPPLRRRLDERDAPARPSRPGRGRIGLDLSGRPEIESLA